MTKKLFSLLLILLTAFSISAQTRTDKLLKNLHDNKSKYIFVIAHRGDWRNAPENSLQSIEKAIAIAEQVEVLRKKNVKNLYFIKEDQFLGTDHEGTVDGTHPNDLGFDRMLKKYKPAISKILKIKFKAE